MKGILKFFAFLLFTSIFSLQAKAHDVDYYTSCGYVCTGSTITIDAAIVAAGSGTFYNWEYRDNSGTWKCFVNGSNTINGKVFTVSGASAKGPANDAPLLSIQNASAELENLEVRILMADNGTPCGNPTYSVWGGDKDPDNIYKSLRLHVLSGADCNTISTYCGMGGCNGNTLSDANGYYGGFEASNNFASAGTNYSVGGGCTMYNIVNNPLQSWSWASPFAPRSGSKMMIVDGSSTSSNRVWFKNNVSVVNGSTYQFSVWATTLYNTTTNLANIIIKVGGITVGSGTVSSVAGFWTNISGSFVATTTGNVTIEVFDGNTSCSDNDFAIDDICFKFLSASPVTTNVCGTGTFNPFNVIEDFNVFSQNNVEFNNGHVDGSVALGGDLVLNGASSVAMANAGTYPNGSSSNANLGLVVGGKIIYTSGGYSYLNSGNLSLGNTTGTKLWELDPNNATVNLRATSNALTGWNGYNSQPALQVQKQQTAASATTTSGLNFTTAFSTLASYSNTIAGYSATSACSSQLNIISVSGTTPTVTLVSNKVNVINITGTTFAGFTQITFTNKPTASTPLIFNINHTGSLTDNFFQSIGLSNTDAGYILYNFYNATGNIQIEGANAMYGSVLIPNGQFTWNNSNNLEGQVASKSFLLCAGEIHCNPFNACLPNCAGVSCEETNETFPNQFNTGFTASLTNSTFVGSSGTWTANSNAQATIVCTQAAYSPSTTQALKIVNSSTFGKAAGTCSAASPKVDLSSVCCPTELNLNFTLWTYNCVSGDANASLNIDFSSDNGSTWTNVWTRTSAQLFTAYGVNGKTAIVVSIPTNYQTANFKYRFRGEMGANNSNNFYQFIDDITISSPTTCSSSLTLGNTVWYDVNNNGTQDAGEPGIAGVVVKLYNCSGTFLNKTATTDASGNYQFTALAASSYIVGITTPAGYTKSDAGTTNVATDNQNDGVNIVSTEIRTNCFTTTGSTNNIDFGLKGTGSIGDFVWNDLNANGIQDGGGETGLSGVIVTLTLSNGTQLTTTTSSTGAYSFSNLAPGTYSVTFTTPDGYTASNPTQGNDATKDSNPVNGVASVTLTAGQSNVTIDAGFYVTPCTGRITSLYFNKLDGGTDIAITQGSAFTPAQLNSLYNIEAGFSGSVGSVKFTISGPTPSSNTENTSPYNSPATGGGAWTGAEGNYSVNVQVYSAANAGGTLCHDTTINFTYSSLCIKRTETFPNQYNTGFSKPITNGTFTGSTGTFTVNASANATVVVTTPYYSPGTSHAIKIVNWATNGSQGETPTPGVGTTTTVSPQINLTNICCPAELTLQYTLWTYTVNALDNNTTFAWDFSNDNGATWNQIISTTPAAINAAYGANGKVTLSIPVPVMYQNANFRYRIRTSKPINNAYNFFVFIDDIIVSSPLTCAATVNLGNQVWFDINNNGVKDASEPGINGITTNLYLDANGDNIPDGAAIATTTTNASGNYSFSGLPAGKYIVGVVMPTGYSASATTTNSSNPNSDTDNDNNGVTTVGSELRSNSITLTVGGEPANGVDGDGTNGNLTLDFGLKGSLNVGNLIWNDINGNGIKNTFESGIAGVTVYLYQDANADNVPDGAAIATTTTATGGIYGFSNLIPGNYIVGIATPAGYAKSFTPTSGSTVNNNTDNDNNGVTETAGIIYTKYNTLSIGGEPDVAVDGDGTNGNLTLDIAIAKDTDGDKIPDVIDIDDDNDGITDLNESGGYDPLADCDNDGIPNYLDSTPGCTTLTGNDPWVKPYTPLTWSDCNSDGVNDFFDWDRDGIINELDLDSDNDGILDVQEARPNGVAVAATANGMITGTDVDANGLLSSYENGNTNPVLNGIAAQDFDRDGTPNFLDLDSDGDGITDLTEALGVYSTTGVVSGTDTDGDGVRAESFGSSAVSTADNINGFGAKGIALLDTDSDGKPNSFDIDSDNDGITDNAEGQSTCSNKLPSGNDCDNDGVDDSYDVGGCSSCLKTSGGITPFDKDADGTPDYIDLDTDNDGAPDIYEGHSIPSPTGNVPPTNYWIAQIGDTDKDGLLDYFDGLNILTATGGSYWRNVINNNMGNNGVWDTGIGATGSISQLPKSQVSDDCAVGDRDWRNITILPASLVEFKGNLNNNIVNVTWTVTKEINLSHYEVERSINGSIFTKVANVQAANAGLALVSYSSTDDISALAVTTVYYRIKIVEKDGSFKNSNIISFKLNNKKAGIVVNPNPATTYFTLKITTAKDAVAQVKVIDMMGKTLITQNNKVMTGVNTYTFNNLSNFSAGTYSVQVMIDNQLYSEKLIVVKY